MFDTVVAILTDELEVAGSAEIIELFTIEMTYCNGTFGPCFQGQTVLRMRHLFR